LIAYFDASSLVKLFVREEGTDEVRLLLDAASTVTTSLVSYAEARSAFARRAREGTLASSDYDRVRSSFENEWQSFAALEVTQSIVRHAADLAALHGLRTLDGIHLASFHSVVAAMPGEMVRFSSFDGKLSAAAERR
jgi:predicted nucleic acid-binding protein